MNSAPSTATLLRRLRYDRRGASIVVFMLTLVGIMGSAATVVDLGNAFVARRSLQSSTDASALAGAAEINCCDAQPGKALATAVSYSAKAGSANAAARWDVSIAPNFPQLKCLSSIGVPCSGSDSSNAIVVRQTATVPTYFARLFGLNTINVSATSTASLAGGVVKPMEVLLLLDTTGSMNEPDAGCTIGNKTKFACATKGAQDLLTGMAPSGHKIGMMTFPPSINAASAAKAYDCNATTKPESAGWVVTNGVYDMVAMGNDFRTSDNSPVNTAGTGNNLNSNSNLVKALGGAGTSCKGLTTMDWNSKGPGGSGGTAYAEAMIKARAKLESTGSGSDVQKAIIILTDGAANRAQGGKNEQCNLAVKAAKDAAAAGIWVYSVAYGLGSGSSGCTTDTAKPISPCETLRQMASDPSKFFSSETGGTGCKSAANPATGIAAVFPAIGKTFFGTRLLPNNTI